MIEDRDFFVVDPIEGCYLNDIFDEAKPIYVEIGSGKGEFISRYPQSHTNWNFIGMEMSEKRIRNCLKKLSVEQNPNVRLVRKFVDASIKNLFRPQSVSGVYIQHPDPWPKRRHHRRRLIQQDFLNSLAEIMLSDATVQISTDHAEYAAWIVEEFLNNPHYLSIQDDPIQMQPNLDEHISTWFELEQKKSGHMPHFMLFKRI
ncbi:MAG: tRNA (guanosine(46)-N7)-methyltransferase TrmB [Candidatus Cloacimonetes bacterium]|nr:tRNA (guanosine(46)-N7)-methyltransferase TrmB [Candidatus Cloacimonadota bacterium]